MKSRSLIFSYPPRGARSAHTRDRGETRPGVYTRRRRRWKDLPALPPPSPPSSPTPSGRLRSYNGAETDANFHALRNRHFYRSYRGDFICLRVFQPVDAPRESSKRLALFLAETAAAAAAASANYFFLSEIKAPECITRRRSDRVPLIARRSI